MTTDPSLRGNLLDTVYNFLRIITDANGTNPLYTETEKSSSVSVNALDRTENIYRGYYMTARRHEISGSSSVENISQVGAANKQHR